LTPLLSPCEKLTADFRSTGAREHVTRVTGKHGRKRCPSTPSKFINLLSAR
jgi:hypothetical protein